MSAAMLKSARNGVRKMLSIISHENKFDRIVKSFCIPIRKVTVGATMEFVTCNSVQDTLFSAP